LGTLVGQIGFDNVLGLAYCLTCIPIGIRNETDGNAVPKEYALLQNYPNPFNPNTTIKYQVPELNFISLKVYDVLGSEVATLVNEEKPIGSYEVDFNSHSGEVRNLPSGVYFYRLQANDFTQVKKMILLK
jgi:hypothetical protein